MRNIIGISRNLINFKSDMKLSDLKLFYILMTDNTRDHHSSYGGINVDDIISLGFPLKDINSSVKKMTSLEIGFNIIQPVKHGRNGQFNNINQVSNVFDSISLVNNRIMFDYNEIFLSNTPTNKFVNIDLSVICDLNQIDEIAIYLSLKMIMYRPSFAYHFSSFSKMISNPSYKYINDTIMLIFDRIDVVYESSDLKYNKSNDRFISIHIKIIKSPYKMMSMEDRLDQELDKLREIYGIGLFNKLIYSRRNNTNNNHHIELDNKPMAELMKIGSEWHKLVHKYESETFRLMFNARCALLSVKKIPLNNSDVDKSDISMQMNNMLNEIKTLKSDIDSLRQNNNSKTRVFSNPTKPWSPNKNPETVIEDPEDEDYVLEEFRDMLD